MRFAVSGSRAWAMDDNVQRHREAVRARLRQSGLARPGPDSISWTINREVIVIAGWARAILMQFAPPAIAAAVHDHSPFRRDFRSGVARLRSTVGAMQAITFSGTEQMIAAAARINAIHDRVNGRVQDRPARAYTAQDPELQRWVHATLLESIPLTYELVAGSLGAEDRDRYCEEAAIMEPLLGMPAGWLPRSSAELDAYMAAMLAGGAIAVTDTSRALARALLYPPKWRALWPVFRPLQLITIGTLPPAIRQAYGFEWRARDRRAFARWTTVLRMVLRLLPRIAREWPRARQQQPSIGEICRRFKPRPSSG